MEKKVRFARFMKLEEVEKMTCREEFIRIRPFFDRVGGKIFKILNEEDDTVIISVDDELKKIEKTFISEILEYDRSEVLSALKKKKKVCKCHTSIHGDCDDTCPFYGEVDGNEKCKLVELPIDWTIVDEEIWRAIR